MRSKTILIALFAITLVVAGFGVLHSTAKKGDDIPKQQILSASVKLSAGTLLRAEDIVWKPVLTVAADEIAQPDAAEIQAKPDIVETTAASVYGAVLRHPLAAGTPIRRGDIVKPGDRDFLQVVLRPGTRAVAIPVATGGASTGLLAPGDHVDVLLTQNFKDDKAEEAKKQPIVHRSVGEVIVRNLRVLAIDIPDGKVNNANPATGNFGRTVTMEVTPDQAETINVAAELGKLSVTLRSANQTADDNEPTDPKWAGDVSPALKLTEAAPAAVPSKPRLFVVMHGSKTEIVNPDQQPTTSNQ